MKKLILGTLLAFTLLQADKLIIDFENFHIGDLPSNWTTVSKWGVEEKNSNKIVSMLKRDSSYNLCFNKNIKFKDGKISVKFKANSGSYDQGGGIMWRVQDKNNYYVARFNPLEDNFRFYKVIHGYRIELASANINLNKGWHSMSIVQNKDHFSGYLDGKKLLNFSDNSISKSGAVGIWTKADANTSFDNLIITSQIN